MHTPTLGHSIGLAALIIALAVSAIVSFTLPLTIGAQTTSTPPATVTDPAPLADDATTPGLPAAGEGGNAGETFMLLAFTGLIAIAGAAYLMTRNRLSAE